MALLDKREIDKVLEGDCEEGAMKEEIFRAILNDILDNGLEEDLPTELVKEIICIKNLCNRTNLYKFNGYHSNTIYFNVDIEKLIHFNEIKWQYQNSDNKPNISEHLIKLTPYGRLFLFCEESLYEDFEEMDIKLLVDETKMIEGRYYGEIENISQLKSQCDEIEGKLFELIISDKVINHKLLNKAGIKVEVAITYNGCSDVFNYIETSIRGVLNEIYFPEINAEDYALFDYIMIDLEDCKQFVEDELHYQFDSYAKCDVKNIEELVIRRRKIRFAEYMNGNMFAPTELGVSIMKEMFTPENENYFVNLAEQEYNRAHMATTNKGDL